ncbi:esterase [Oceanobacillus oncorhynchi subsp. incaldanensis]|uniref:Alpha/beta hydrolase n=2 Tax=Oceanobacillus TaxID=182709 RepID=A0ABV9K376_9BACI|nr:alpha/beta hydrolase-fold protein [Oceanobacillus oncorhynchi]MDM8099657.1 alpha/beta hydrolase-fold protein [Oceanobacillus oncorhynchi]UUI41890.1 alpha/beta hydrolase-fold protein [Oceanobacillus oncorhynchi]GIO19942.1 esterase [Oceanobacillus oncorhynchi subsp. incaldanensis]CEI83394.1 Putative esterase [Oceanobacillus oncorhynchi]
MRQSYFYLKLESHELPMAYKKENRRVRVLLPKDYGKEKDRHYPVVYMHDGQNVFYSSEAYSGYSWKVIPAIKRNPDLPKMIIVGIDNGERDRINEYTPWKITESPLPEDIELGGRGAEFAEFIMTVVKPFIDEHYRTKPDKYHTAMIGSSLGGNISAFMGIEYKDQIGGLGIFSLANWITNKAFDHYMERETLDPEQRVYVQVGTEEGDDADRQLMYGNMKQAYIDCSLKYYKQLVKGGIPIDHIDLNIFSDEEHNEEAWSKHLPECFRFLGANW